MASKLFHVSHPNSTPSLTMSADDKPSLSIVHIFTDQLWPNPQELSHTLHLHH